jgi:hypothetical protein
VRSFYRFPENQHKNLNFPRHLRRTYTAAVKEECANVSELMKPPPPLKFGIKRRPVRAGAREWN